MVTFASGRSPCGFFAPARFEADLFDCETEGRIPSDLDGALYRMHGDWFYPPAFEDEASLSADGYISSFRFKNGSVDYRGRYVRTDRYCRQRAARRQLYGYYRNPYSDEPDVRNVERPHLRTSANTTPVVLAGRLYATKEEGLPYEIDPVTLETRGATDFDGAWGSQTFTAHPKRDPVTGETFAFGYEATGLASNDIFLSRFDRAGNIDWEIRFEVPYSSMLHDMAITRDFVVIPGGGCVTSIERLKAGHHHWGWDRTRPSYYAVIPRGGTPDQIRWFAGDERSIVHIINAWNEGDRIFLDAPMASGNTWPWFEDVHGGAFSMPSNSLRRATLDLTSNDARVEESILFDKDTTSFTRIDERFTGLPYRYTWVQFTDPERPFEIPLPDDPRVRPNNSYARFDVAEGTIKTWFAGPAYMLQEPVFVPAAADAPEGEGYLVGTAHNLAAMRSELVILDAAQMAEVGRVILPFRNAAQVHGVWASATELPLG